MQPETKLKKGLYNSGTGVDWSATIITNDTAGYYLIKNATGELLVPPILRGSIIKVDFEASAVEVVQMVTIGDQSQVIVANTRYGVTIEFPKDRYSGITHERRIFSVMSAVTLSGVAATDRANVYLALAEKINAYVPQYTKAKLATLFFFKGAGTVTVAGFAAGAKWYVGANLGAATWVGHIAKATGALAAAVGQNVLLVTESGTFPADATTAVFKAVADDAVQSVADLASTFTTRQGLVVYDEGGYFSLKEKIGRGGAPIIFTTPTFTLRPVLLQAAVLSHGIGTDMLTETPEFNLTRDGVDRGDIQRQFTSRPISGKTYRLYLIRCKATSIPDAIDGGGSNISVVHHLYVEEAVHANVAAALIGLT